MTYDRLFAECLERLLQGQVICDITFFDGYRLLQQEEHWEAANDILERMGRRLTQTADGLGFYLIYTDLDLSDARKKVANSLRSQAKEHWEMLLMWLRFTRKLSDDNFPLQAGDPLELDRLLHAAENSSSLQEEIDQISRGFGLRAKDTKSQIESILNYLAGQGFLVKKPGSVSTYTATARWSLLKDQMEYVNEQEGIVRAEAMEDSEPVQQELLGV